MVNKNDAIGIFDSGMGGLAVVKAIKAKMPNEKIYYLADTQNLPYGSKSPEELKVICSNNIDFFNQYPLKALVVACNTASAFISSDMTSSSTPFMYDAITPSVEQAVLATKNQKIAVLATEMTVKSGVYEALLKKKMPECEVTSIACPLWVPVVEEKMLSHSLATLLINQYLQTLYESCVDTIILGCTHYALLRALITETFPRDVTWIDSAQCSVEHLELQLKSQKLLAEQKPVDPDLFFVPGVHKNYGEKISQFLEEEVVVESL